MGKMNTKCGKLNRQEVSVRRRFQRIKAEINLLNAEVGEIEWDDRQTRRFKMRPETSSVGLDLNQSTECSAILP